MHRSSVCLQWLTFKLKTKIQCKASRASEFTYQPVPQSTHGDPNLCHRHRLIFICATWGWLSIRPATIELWTIGECDDREPPMHNCSVGQINDAAPLSHTLINWIDQVVVVVGRSYSSAPPCDNEPCFPKHSSNNMRFLQALLIYPILSANRVYHTPPPAPCDLECDILPTHSESGPSISFIVFEQRLWSRFRFRLVQRK